MVSVLIHTAGCVTDSDKFDTSFAGLTAEGVQILTMVICVIIMMG